MARTAITPLKTARNTFTAAGTLAAPLANGVAIDQANGMTFSPKRGNKCLIFVYNSSGGTPTVTVRKGVYPPAEEAAVGDLVSAAMPTLSFMALTGLDGSRFVQSPGGAYNLDFTAGATGVIWVVEMPA